MCTDKDQAFTRTISLSSFSPVIVVNLSIWVSNSCSYWSYDIDEKVVMKKTPTVVYLIESDFRRSFGGEVPKVAHFLTYTHLAVKVTRPLS